MVEEFWKWFFSFFLGGGISFLFAYVKFRRKRDRALEEGVQSLLRDEIIRQYEKHEERGYCPIYAKEALKREYHSYHALGGNDVATELYNKLLELPSDPPHKEERIEYR